MPLYRIQSLFCLILVALFAATISVTEEEISKKIDELSTQLSDIKAALIDSGAPSVVKDVTPDNTNIQNSQDLFWNNNDVVSPRVYLFTFMDKVSNYGCASIRSAIMSYTNVTIFGLSDQLHRANGDRYHGFRFKGDKIKKVYIMHKFLEQLAEAKDAREDDIIIFNDGFDVLYTPNSNKLVETFKSVEKPNTALFAAERTCWGPKQCKEQDTGTTFRYVNSGDYIARFNVALRLLRTWIEVMHLQGEEAEDQTAVHQIILGKGDAKTGTFLMESIYATLKQRDENFIPVNVLLDSGCVVFQTGMKTKLSDGTWATKPDREQGPYLSPAGTIVNTETGTEPLFVHFNGERYWFMPVEQLYHDRFVVPGSRGAKEFSALCYSYLRLYPALQECTKLLKVNNYCQ